MILYQYCLKKRCCIVQIQYKFCNMMIVLLNIKKMTKWKLIQTELIKFQHFSYRNWSRGELLQKLLRTSYDHFSGQDKEQWD
jgi:hypothetical protein